MRAAVITATVLAAAIIACSGGPPTAHPTLEPPKAPINQEVEGRKAATLQQALLERIAQNPNPAVLEKTNLTRPTEAAPTGLPTATNLTGPTAAAPAGLPTATTLPPAARDADPTKQNTGVSIPDAVTPDAATPQAVTPENTREAAFEILRQHSWASDGLSDAEKETAESIANLIRAYPDIGMRLVRMPFLETHEPTDAGAATALWYIATIDPDQTRRILDHPSLRSGITDAQTPRVTLTYAEYLFGADPARVLSDQGIQSHTHPAELPMAGNILITIVSRTGPERAATTAARVQSELAWLETYLDQELYTHNVVIHYGATMPPAAKGANVQTSVMQPAHHQNAGQHHWVQHELAHYWFNSNETWLNEGMAQILTSLVAAGSRQPATLPETAPRCSETVRLKDIQEESAGNQPASRCVYAVGERIMRTLHQEAGYEDFRKGARRLAARGARPPYQGMGLDHLREAFDHVPAAMAEAERRWR